MHIKQIKRFTFQPRTVKNMTDEAWDYAKKKGKEGQADAGSYLTYLVIKDKLKDEKNGKDIN